MSELYSWKVCYTPRLIFKISIKIKNSIILKMSIIINLSKISYLSLGLNFSKTKLKIKKLRLKVDPSGNVGQENLISRDFYLCC